MSHSLKSVIQPGEPPPPPPALPPPPPIICAAHPDFPKWYRTGWIKFRKWNDSVKRDKLKLMIGYWLRHWTCGWVSDSCSLRALHVTHRTRVTLSSVHWAFRASSLMVTQTRKVRKSSQRDWIAFLNWGFTTAVCWLNLSFFLVEPSPSEPPAARSDLGSVSCLYNLLCQMGAVVQGGGNKSFIVPILFLCWGLQQHF